MTTVNIDNVEYEFESLSDDAKAQFNSLKFVEVELQKAEAMIAVLQTARGAYARALKSALPAAAMPSETIKF